MKNFKYQRLSPEHKSKYWFEIFKAMEANKEDNRTLILITNGFIEIMTEILIKETKKNKNNILTNGNVYTYGVRLLILNESGVIHDYRYNILDFFRKLRNRAAHEPLFNIELSEIRDYINSMASIGEVAKPTLKAETFKDFCVYLLVTFWADHTEIFTKSVLGVDM